MRRLEINNPDKVRQQILAYLASDDEQIQYIVRLHAILLLSQQDGPSPAQIAALYGITHPTITRWINRLNDSKTGDISVLLDTSKPGRNTRMDKKQLAAIDKLLTKPPHKVGIMEDKWTGALLSEYLLKHYGIELKIRMCQRWIRRLKEAEVQREKQAE